MKEYLLTLLQTCAPENGFAQDALEFAITSGLIRLTYQLEADTRLLMENYDAILSAYRAARSQTLVAA